MGSRRNKFKRLRTHKRIFSQSYITKRYSKSDPMNYLSKHYKKIKHLLLGYLHKHKSIKFQLCLSVLFKRKVNDEIQRCEPWFVSDMMTLNTRNQITFLFNLASEQIVSRFDCWVQHGSGCQLSKILSLDLQIIKIVRVLHGGAAPLKVCHPDLPKCLKNKKALLNVKSPKGECFAYAIASCLKRIPGRAGPSRSHHYRTVVDKLQGTSSWMPLYRMKNCEMKNKISINIYGWDIEKQKITVLYLSDVKHRRVCNLMLYGEHYYSIRNMSRLVHKSKSKRKTHICSWCLSVFQTLSAIGRHNRICALKGQQVFTAAEPGSFIEFTNFAHMVPKEYVYFADMETMLIDCEQKRGDKTTLVKRPIPVSFGLLRVCCNPQYNKGPIVHHGENILDKFWKTLDHEFAEIQNIMNTVYHPIDMSRKQKETFKKSTHCHICSIKFSNRVRKVKDHCHITPRRNFRFALCNKCNLTYAASRLSPIPIFMHNLSGYDSHLIISQLKNRYIKVIPKNSERVLSFTVDNWRFVDSLAFLPASLQVLVDSLKQESQGIEYFANTCKIADKDIQINFLLNKNPYPYEYAQSLCDYDAPGLPEQDAFFNSMKNEHISDDEYDYAQRVFRLFNCNTFKDYHLLYLKVDCTLLADVFQRLRSLCIETCALDPAYYVSSPQLSYDCLLKSSGIRLECLYDMSMIDLFHDSIRGGISMVCKRYARANNKYLDDFDPTKPSSFILKTDCVNLYGFAMKSKLPYAGFKWLSADEIRQLDVAYIDTDGSIGYVFEVDLDYPVSLHDITGSYPLAPETLTVREEYLSPSSLEMKKKLSLPKQNNVIKKLVPNVWHKRKYVTHLKILQYYLKRGMFLRQIHRVLQFKQKSWLSDFVDINTEKRRESKSDF